MRGYAHRGFPPDRLSVARHPGSRRTSGGATTIAVNPSYVRIRVPKVEALRRFATWQGLGEVGPLAHATASQATELACDDLGQWKGQAVLVSEVADWSLFADLTGGLSAVTSASWLAFAGADDLVFAGYNDAIGYGAIVMISGGVVVQDILFDAPAPEPNACIDRRSGEHVPIGDWRGVARFVDEDELGFAENGELWIYKAIGEATAE